MMLLRELITSQGGEQVSHTRFWHNVAQCAGTFGFVWKVCQGTDSPEIWLIYLGIVGVSATASKLIAMKYGAGTQGDTDKEAK
jgi:hypothetical protein